MNTKPWMVSVAFSLLSLLVGCGKDFTSMPGASGGGGGSSSTTQDGVSACVTAPFAGGDGSLGSPYQIATVCHLEKFAASTALWNKNFQFVSDIDMTGVTFSPQIDNFTGVLDGNGYAMKNWITDVPFLSTSTGTVKNLGLLNISLSFGGNSRGAFLVGTNELGGAIQYCMVTGSLSSSGPTLPAFIGGLAGINKGAVQNSVVNASISGGEAVGGAVGFNSGTISQVSMEGTVSGPKPDGTDGVGGLVGWNKGILSNSHSQATVNGVQVVGGLVGQNAATIEKCYSTGMVSATGANVGGMVGFNAASGTTLVSSYWDTQTSGRGTSAAGVGKTTAEMFTQGTFSGWDFSGVWSFSAGNYPDLR